MSAKELERVEVMARVTSGELQLGDAAVLLRVSYRQAKRLIRRYRHEGPSGLRHRGAGRSNRGKPAALRQQALQLVRQKYSGSAEERFGPTLAAEHLAQEDGVQVHPETLRRCSRTRRGGGLRYAEPCRGARGTGLRSGPRLAQPFHSHRGHF